MHDGTVGACEICQDTESMEDDARSFFVHCYHVRDWIVNDDNAPSCIKKKVNEFVRDNTYMKICADMSNGIKHFKRNRSPLSPSQPEFAGRDYKISLLEAARPADSMSVDGESDSVSKPLPVETGRDREISSSVDLRIEVGEETFHAFEIATHAMEAWETFIRENGGDC